MERNEDLAVVIRTIQVGYAKVLKSAWMEHDWKFEYNKMMWCKKINRLMQYHDL